MQSLDVQRRRLPSDHCSLANRRIFKSKTFSILRRDSLVESRVCTRILDDAVSTLLIQRFECTTLSVEILSRRDVSRQSTVTTDQRFITKLLFEKKINKPIQLIKAVECRSKDSHPEPQVPCRSLMALTYSPARRTRM